MFETPEFPPSHRTPVGAPRLGVLAVLVPLLLSTSLVGCGDDPFQLRWSANPDTVILYALSRPELNLPSGFSFNPRGPVRIESPDATGTWDLAVDAQGDDIFLVPPGAMGITSTAGIASLSGMSFDDVREAPRDTAAYAVDGAVPVVLGTIYVIRTRQVASGIFRTNCVYYAKLEPVALGIEEGTLEFAFDTNPVCNDNRLVPPDS